MGQIIQGATVEAYSTRHAQYYSRNKPEEIFQRIESQMMYKYNDY